MSEDTNKVLAIYRVLFNESNIRILKELREEPKYILELEEKVGLDRVTIKRRLYVMANLGIVETNTKRTPKGGRAVYYKLKNVKLPSLDLFTIIDNADTIAVREMSRVYRY
jgi:predicted transcriptional regulator